MLQIFGICALTSDQIPVPRKSKDPGHHAVQKIAVMRHDDQNAGKTIQIILENTQRLYIQIIGRLVKDQYIRSFHQHLQQIETPLLSSG